MITDPQPVLTVVNGNPTPEEVAALTAVVASLAAAAAAEPRPTPTRRWARQRELRLRPTPGPGAWQRAVR